MKRKKLFGQPNIFLEWAGKSVYKSELSVFSSRETFIIFNRCSARSSVRFRTYKIYRFKNIPPPFFKSYYFYQNYYYYYYHFYYYWHTLLEFGKIEKEAKLTRTIRTMSKGLHVFILPRPKFPLRLLCRPTRDLLLALIKFAKLWCYFILLIS